MHMINVYISQQRVNSKCCSKSPVTNFITVQKYATVN